MNSELSTIDGMLVAFRRCPFRQYMPKMPAKYDIKNFALVDFKNFYIANLKVYLGKQPEGNFSIDNSTTTLVKRTIMLMDISGSSKNLYL